MVGAGAIGCELLKNFAMLNISTDITKKGKIYLTDPDIIEVSNLSRQFLFREKHIRMPKSVTAAYSVKNMSKTINVLPLQEKVAPSSENIFTRHGTYTSHSHWALEYFFYKIDYFCFLSQIFSMKIDV